VTGFVNRKWQNSTPYRIRTFNWWIGNLLQFIASAVLISVPNLVQIRPRAGDFCPNAWNRTKVSFIYRPILLETHTHRQNVTLNDQNDADSRDGVPFGSRRYWNLPNTSDYKGVNRQKIKTCVLSKLLNWFQLNFAQTKRPPNTLGGWSAYENNKPKMADGRYFE